MHGYDKSLVYNLHGYDKSESQNLHGYDISAFSDETENLFPNQRIDEKGGVAGGFRPLKS